MSTVHTECRHVKSRECRKGEKKHARHKDELEEETERWMWKTDSHFGPLDLPLVSVALIPTPFCLQKVEDARQGEVLAVLRWRRRDALALALLAERVLLLVRRTLISLGVGLGWRHLERAKHGYLDCLWMVNVGRALVVVRRWRSGIILGVVSPVELMEHVALLGGGEGILRVLLALLRVLLLVGLCGGLEVQEEAGSGEHRRRAMLCWLQTTDAAPHDRARRAPCRRGRRQR